MEAQMYYLSIPMKRAFNHAKSGRDKAESIILTIKHNGITGIGECVPRKYVTGETMLSVAVSILDLDVQKIMSLINFSSLERAINTKNEACNILQATNEVSPNVLCVIDMALLDLIGKLFNYSIKEIIQRFYLTPHLHGNKKSYMTSQVMDLSLNADEFLRTRGPFHYVKVKVGKDVDDNIKRIEQIRDGVGKSIPILVDANMSWDIDEAVKMVNAFKPFNVDFYEEPLTKGDFVNYKLLRKITSAKILLDESLCSIDDARKAVEHDACDAFNIRISKCGGITKSIELIKFAHDHNLDFQIGAQVAETGPLIAAGRHLAAAANQYFTFEAGQPDRFFDKSDYIIDEMPLVDRKTNLASFVNNPGLGVNLNNHIAKFIKNKFVWKCGQWHKV